MPTASPMREALSRAISPLSSYQRRVWRLIGTHAERALYERICVRITGPLPVAALAGAVDDVNRRHAILRAVFPIARDRPVQCAQSSGGPLSLVDLRGLPPSVRERAAQCLTRRDRQPAFDVRRGPLMRVALLQMGADDHIWLACVHHLVFDGGSRPILMRELESILMQAPLARVPAPQYGDLARREQLPAAVSRRAARVAAVAGRLRDRPPPATLPSDRPRSSYRTRRGEVLSFDVSKDTVRALRGLCRAEGLSLFMLLLAALAVVLRRASNRDEVVCGIPVANRTSIEAEAMIGPFINILVVRLQASAGMRFCDVAAHTRAAMLEALADRDVPFDDILAALYPGQPLDNYGPAGGPPLFRVCMDFEDEAGSSASDAAGAPSQGLSLTPFEPADAIAGCDLTVSFTVSPSGAASGIAVAGEGLSGGVLYSVELFDRETVLRFISSFLAALQAMTSFQSPVTSFQSDFNNW